MIVKDSETRSYICPIMSFRHQRAPVAEPCRGKMCMAWREVTKDYGFCGMTSAGAGYAYTTKEEVQIEALEENENDV